MIIFDLPYYTQAGELKAYTYGKEKVRNKERKEGGREGGRRIRNNR